MENRKSKRLPLEIGCWLVQMDEASCFHTLDFSETGMSVHTTDHLPVGKIVNLQIFTPASADAVNVEAEVMWSNLEDQESMGLRFINMDEQAAGAIREIAYLVQQRRKLETPPSEPGDVPV